MLLLCGATGLLGGKIAERLAQRGEPFRVLLRPSVDAAPLASLGAEIARGDLRKPGTLGDAVFGTRTVVTTVTAIGRALGGERISLDAVDRKGTLALVDAAEQAGAERFVYVSASGMDEVPRMPLARAKLAVEERLRRSRMRELIVRPEPFQEIWVSPVAKLDWDAGRLTILGRGDCPTGYVAVDDVADAVVRLALAADPPRVVELAGPEKMTRNELADLIEEVAGRPMQRRHLSPALLRAASRLLAPVRPAVASLLALGLLLDSRESGDDAAFAQLGIAPRPVSDYVRQAVPG